VDVRVHERGKNRDAALVARDLPIARTDAADDAIADFYRTMTNGRTVDGQNPRSAVDASH
jgi:hypothetical protein